MAVAAASVAFLFSIRARDSMVDMVPDDTPAPPPTPAKRDRGGPTQVGTAKDRGVPGAVGGKSGVETAGQKRGAKEGGMAANISSPLALVARFAQDYCFLFGFFVFFDH
jgi:hypothetical protein